MTPAWPDFLLVGGPKCATSSMYWYLRDHPDIHMPPKELAYFGEEQRRVTAREYHAAFAGKGARLAGDATVRYLASPSACQEIAEMVPNARILVMLRNPVETIGSMHADAVFLRQETIADLDEALAAEAERRRAYPPGQTHQLLYREQVRWDEHLARYMAAFEHVHVTLFDDFVADSVAAYKSVLRFLDVDEAHTPHRRVYNARKRARHAVVQRLIANPSATTRRIIRRAVPLRARRTLARRLLWWNSEPLTTAMSTSTAEQLLEELSPSIDRLEMLIGRDLSQWKDLSRRRNLPEQSRLVP